MSENFTNTEWSKLFAIKDKGFKKALVRSEFSWVGPNGEMQVKTEWLFAWAYSDDCGNRRYSKVAAEIRDIWKGHTLYNKEIFLPEARRLRYL